LPGGAAADTQALQGFEPDDAGETWKITGELRGEPRLDQRPAQGAGFIETDVDLRIYVAPLEEPRLLRSGIPCGVEEQSAGFQKPPNPAERGEGILQVLQNLDGRDHVERAFLGRKLAAR